MEEFRTYNNVFIVRLLQGRTNDEIARTLKDMIDTPGLLIASVFVERALDEEQSELLRRFIETNTTMEYLHIRSCACTTDVLYAVSHALRTNKTLSWLAIDDAKDDRLDRDQFRVHLAKSLSMNPVRPTRSTWSVFIDPSTPIDCFLQNDLPALRKAAKLRSRIAHKRRRTQ